MTVINNADIKLRGGYYTPRRVANFLSKWAISDKTVEILEPSAGNGQFVEAIYGVAGDRVAVTAVELDSVEANQVVSKGGASTTVITGDFFNWYVEHGVDGAYDAVLGNPPFIRYQQFKEEHRKPAFYLMEEEGLRPSRLTNAWLPFVTVATRALRQGGRLAMVLPAELLQVKYAEQLRGYLASRYSRLSVITFRKLLFPQIQQETVLLLGTRQDNSAAEVSFYELDGPEDLDDLSLRSGVGVKADLDHSNEKWTQYYLSNNELGLIREIAAADDIPRLGTLAEVDVGVVTGRNEFFVLTESEAREHGILDWSIPLVSRAAQIKGLVLNEEQWQHMVAMGNKCHLIQFGRTSREDLPPQARAYVLAGEEKGFHTRYKCRIRLPNWWFVPSVWSPDAFMLRQIYDGPRIIHNPGNVVCTDTIHRLRAIGTVDSSQLAASSMNSLTYAFAELGGRSYGGGVLELEPTEAESLPFPVSREWLDVESVDWLARQNSTERVLDWVDGMVLQPAGFSRSEIKTLRNIWHQLFTRRLRRKQT